MREAAAVWAGGRRRIGTIHIREELREVVGRLAEGLPSVLRGLLGAFQEKLESLAQLRNGPCERSLGLALEALELLGTTLRGTRWVGSTPRFLPLSIELLVDTHGEC